jgi:hypothetical protein
VVWELGPLAFFLEGGGGGGWDKRVQAIPVVGGQIVVEVKVEASVR